MLTPEDLLSFYETSIFRRSWTEAGMNDDDLLSLQIGIMLDPKGGSVIQGTGGLRKIRFAQAQQGKRSGLRVCYAYFEAVGICLLVISYPKNVKEDLSSQERDVIREMLLEQRRLLQAED